jgi:hypothetical protein
VPTGGKWFRYGWIGCLGAVTLVMVAVLVVAGVAALTALPEQVEQRVVTRELPVAASGQALTAGRVFLEIREAELFVEPAGAGEPLRVETTYDVNAFTLQEELDPGPDGSGAWTFHAVFGRSKKSGAFAGLVSVVRGAPAQIHVFLPEDVPIDLVLKMEKGGAVVRLAGLWLRTAEFDFESGAFDLSVAEPLREPMESLSIHTRKGGSLLNGLGNASPRRLDVSYRAGGIDMDLGGRWQRDAAIHISGGMGGGVVHLPAGVIMEGLDLGGIEARVAPELKPPTLAFSISTSMGKLELSDIRLWQSAAANPPPPQSLIEESRR